jgi:hypothetical protein
VWNSVFVFGLADHEQVRNGFEPTRLYLERDVRDSLNRTTVQETEIKRPAQPVAANSAYSMWSIELTDDEITENFMAFTVGAEADGVKISTVVRHTARFLPPCAT